MATSNRRGNRGGSRNNNPEGRNQYSGMMGTARANPLATAVAVGSAVAAGAFLWSRRNRISDQIGDLADTISEWREGSLAGEDAASGEGFIGSASRSRGRRTQAQIAEEALTLKETGSTA